MEIALLVVVVFVCLLLLVPVRLHVAAEGGDEAAVSWAVEVGWLFGWVRGGAHSGPGRSRKDAGPSSAPEGSAHPSAPSAPRRKARASGTLAARQWLKVVRTPGFIRNVRRLVSDLVRQAWPDRVALDARAGLDDPADTGALFGVIAVANATGRALTPSRWPPAFVQITPVFSGPALWARVEVDVRLRPLRALWSVARFVVSWSTLSAAWAALRLRHASRS